MNNFMKDSKIVFASAENAKQYLKKEDIFIKNLSPFDRSARLKTSKEINISEFLDFICEQTLDWNDNEKKVINNIMNNINHDLSEFKMAFPEEIIFIKTTGLEEGNAAYCRGNNIIVLPINIFNYKLILHELFHIYSRNNLIVQEKLYNILSFRKSNELLLPDDIFRLKITNPDAAVNNYYFSSKINEREFDLMPILLSSSNYDEQKAGKFFDYLSLNFIAVRNNGDNMVPVIENNEYFIFKLDQVTNYFELIGRNTNYIIHPEEILAENFVSLIHGIKNKPNMEIIDKMKEILKAP